MGTRMARLGRRGTFVFGEKVVRNELQYEYPRCRYVRDAPIWGVYGMLQPAASTHTKQLDEKWVTQDSDGLRHLTQEIFQVSRPLAAYAQVAASSHDGQSRLE